MGCCSSTSRHSSDPSSHNREGTAVLSAQAPETSRIGTRGSTTVAANGEGRLLTGRPGGERVGVVGRAEEHGAPSQPQEQEPPSLRLPPRSRCRIPKDSGVWSTSRLHSERTAFWETRVTGRNEVWQGLRLVCELLQKREVTEARAVLDATGCVCPSGALWKSVYDEHGQSYDVPAWLIGDPHGLVQDNERAVSDSEDDDDDDDAGEKAVSLNRTEEKGKGRAADVGEIVKIKARLSDRATDVVVKLGQKEHVKVLARRVEEQAGISKPGRVKIVYLGKVLDEHETLSNQNWREGHVVNALVFQ